MLRFSIHPPPSLSLSLSLSLSFSLLPILFADCYCSREHIDESANEKWTGRVRDDCRICHPPTRRCRVQTWKKASSWNGAYCLGDTCAIQDQDGTPLEAPTGRGIESSFRAAGGALAQMRQRLWECSRLSSLLIQLVATAKVGVIFAI